MSNANVRSPAKSESYAHGTKHQRSSFFKLASRYFFSHVLAFKISFRNLSLTPFATLMTIAAIGVCLSLPVGLFLIIKNVEHFSQGWDKDAALSLYIDAKSTPKQIDGIIDKIKSYSFVEKTNYIPPEKALSEFQETSGLKDTLALLPENPLPGVINIQINTHKTTQDEIIKMKEALTQFPMVKQAMFDYEWVEKLNAALAFGKTLGNCLYFIISLGVILMVCNTIRLAVARHKDEIDVLNLIGATTAFIRRPFLYRGILYGGLGGMIAAALITIVNSLLENQAQRFENLFQGIFFLENLTFYDTVLLLVASASLGWLGAAIAFAQQHRLLASESAN